MAARHARLTTVRLLTAKLENNLRLTYKDPMAESPCGISTGTSTGMSQVELFTSDTTKLVHAALQHTYLPYFTLGFIVDITHSTALLSPSFLFHLTVAVQNLIYLT